MLTSSKNLGTRTAERVPPMNMKTQKTINEIQHLLKGLIQQVDEDDETKPKTYIINIGNHGSLKKPSPKIRSNSNVTKLRRHELIALASKLGVKGAFRLPVDMILKEIEKARNRA